MTDTAQLVIIVMLTTNALLLLLWELYVLGSLLTRKVARRLAPSSTIARRTRLRSRLLLGRAVKLPLDRIDQQRLLDSLALAEPNQFGLLLMVPAANGLAAMAVGLVSLTAFSTEMHVYSVYIVVEILAFSLLDPVLMHLQARFFPRAWIGQSARYLILSLKRYRNQPGLMSKQAYATNLRHFLYVAARCGVGPDDFFVGNLKRTAENKSRTAAAVHRNVNDVYAILTAVHSGDHVWPTTGVNPWAASERSFNSLTLGFLAYVPALALVSQVYFGLSALTHK